MSNEKNPEMNMEQIEKLMAELDTLQGSMTAYRGNYDALRQKKRELSDARRSLRQQRREEADEEVRKELEKAIGDLEAEIEQVEGHMEEIDDDIGRIQSDIAEIEEELEELQDEYDYQKKSGFKVVIGGKDIGVELGKAMNKIREIDVEELGDNISQVVDKAVTQIERGVNHFSDVVDAKRNDPDKGDYFFSGATTLPAGDYGKLNFAGAGKLRGDISCQSLKASGSLSADGDILCSGEIRSSGSIKCSGNLSGASTKISGSVKVGQNLQGGSVNVSGSLTVGGKAKAQSIRTGGAITVGEDCETDSFYSAGRVTISGLLNADEVDIHLDYASSTVSSIGCEKITVVRPSVVGVFSDLGFKGAGGTLATDSIEGDVIRLENTTAKIVRGRDVYIGNGCEIECVEYSNKCEVSTNASVKETKLV